MNNDIYGQIDTLREQLVSLSETGEPYEKILALSQELDERIVNFHKIL